MALPGNDAVQRFQENEDRFDKFINDPVGYTDKNGNPVESVQTLAVTLANLESSDIDKGDALVLVKQPFTGTITRTQHDKNTECISVMDYGAIGNGIVDDSAAINAAIANNDNVYFPPGDYRVNTSIILGFNNKRISGAPEGGTVLIGYGAIDVLVVGDSTAGTDGNTFLGTYKNLVQNLVISAGDSAVLHGMLLVGCRESDFINVDVIPLSPGVGFSVAGIELKECWTNNFIGGKVKWVAGKGLYINNTANGPSNNIKFLGTSFYGLGGIGIDDMGGSGRVYQTYVENCEGGGIKTINLQGADICGYFEGNAGFDIKLTTNTYNAFVHGCYFQGYDASHQMVQLSSAFGCTVTNCYMSFSGAAIGAACTGGFGIYCTSGSLSNTLGPLSLAHGVGATGNALVGGSTTAVLTSDFSESPFTFAQKFGGLTTEANGATGATGAVRMTDVGANGSIRDFSWALNRNSYPDIGLYQSAAKGGDPLSSGYTRMYFGALNGSNGGAIRSGSGAPTGGLTGDIYFRNDTPGTALQRVYVNNAGSWTGIV